MVRTVAGLAQRIAVGAASLPGGVQIGHLALHELELADALAELLAVVGIGQHGIHTGRHDAQGSATQHRPFVIQARHQHLHATAFGAQHVFSRYFAVFKKTG